MSKLKTILGWCIGIFIFGYIMHQITLYEERQEVECAKLGMIVIKPMHDKAYCAKGVRL